MEIKGTVSAVLPAVTGQGKNGEWKKQEFVIEHGEGQFKKYACLSLWGEKTDQCPSVGSEVTAHFDVESREYNGRWFTECKAWKVTSAVQTDSPAPVH